MFRGANKMFLILTCKCYYNNVFGVGDWTESSVALPSKRQASKAFRILKSQATAGVEVTWVEPTAYRRAEVLFYENYEDRINDMITVKIYENGDHTNTYKCKLDTYKKCFYRKARREECMQ